jgi:membrane protease YdiL (CAAX protease family)
MSILTTMATIAAATTAPATTAATSPSAASLSVSDRWQLVAVATLLAISISTAALCGCFRRKSIVGPNRIGPDEPVSALWLVFLFAAGFWFMVPMAYGVVVVIRHPPDVPVATTPASGPAATNQNNQSLLLSPDETVWVGIAATLGGLAAALAGTALRRAGFARLGLTRRDLRQAIVPGVIGVVIVLPLVLAAEIGSDLLWRAVHLEHPTEHDLLRILGESTSPALRAGVIVSALLLAPVFEELLFRGYLQTALLGVFSGHRPRRPLPPPLPPFPSPTAVVECASEIGADHSPHIAARWMAVLSASIAFALVHVQFWMMPPIFVLSLCLGYAYERTGKLWVPVLIHATFNTTSLLLFLAIH